MLPFSWQCSGRGTEQGYTDEQRWRTLCPQLQTERLTGCGHSFPLEVPSKASDPSGIYKAYIHYKTFAAT